MEERDNVDWAALCASLADERPVRNLEGARILDFNEFLIPDLAPAGPLEPPTQAFSHGSAEPAVSSHMTTEPQDSAPVGPQERPIQEHSHQPAEAEVSSHETTEAHETTSYSPPHPSQEPTDPSQEPTQALVDTQVHPSAPEVATPDEEEVEFPDLTQPQVLSVPAGLDPMKKHVLVKGASARGRGDDHDLERSVIKRKNGDGDDGEGGGDGMSLRPRDSLRHTTCGTHPR
ncbi:uncharacterized protein LOC132066959 isoform X2 [Lycium ferocissimum]|uniref:uncharacterized protein LOC132066959 isoform X2 n=1 Tax=Lycium ferocissimum TaxID=112874 RepID=UPI0028165784|nr:uncharacterized protein LOC132066959 isoform X2 [Lycium ferocissimum]